MHFDSSTIDNMTEHNAFTTPMGTDDANFMIASMLSNMTSNCQTQPYSRGLNTQRQFMVEFPALSLLQGELMNTPHMSNPSINESCLMGNTNFEQSFVNENETLVSASSLATLLASRFGSRGNLNLIEHLPNNHHEIFNSAFINPLNAGYDTVYGEMNNKWAYDKYLAESIDQNQWISSNSSMINSDKELSLSLASCHTPIGRGTVISDQCSEISGPAVTPLNESHFGSKTSYQSKNLSVGSHKQVQIDQFSSGSRYLCVIQEILAQIASFSLEHFDQMNYPATLTRNSLSRSCLSEKEYSMMDSEVDGGFCATRGREVEAKKQQLVALLEVVDEQHNQCLDEIHTVISAFHAATELDPRIHARFALQTVSALYKSLRERISNQILTMGTPPSRNGENREDGMSFETSFIQKQWALQQLRKKDHQLWRPQRGLPERSVSVLRAWMFQNFLHPYPKDAEKHLLAVKSGLTRSQVSNWFINARVRLWKPMIEEMYTEMNRRKGRRNSEDTNNGQKSHVTFGNMRFDM